MVVLALQFSRPNNITVVHVLPRHIILSQLAIGEFAMA